MDLKEKFQNYIKGFFEKTDDKNWDKEESFELDLSEFVSDYSFSNLYRKKKIPLMACRLIINKPIEESYNFSEEELVKILRFWFQLKKNEKEFLSPEGEK